MYYSNSYCNSHGGYPARKELTKEQLIKFAKGLTSEYAKTHKGRNNLERECIEKGYIVIEPNKLDASVTDNRKMVFALSKNTYGTGKNWVHVCEA